MSRKMLINATRPEEVRVAVVQNTTLEAYEVAASESGLIKGNIYRGIVTNVRPALEAAFIDIGTGKDALLRADDVVAEAMHRKPSGGGRPRIDQILEKGRPIIVQVTRDPIAHKGSQVTTNLSLAGRYLVIMPHDDVRGVSRRTEDDELRKAAKEKLATMDIPDDIGVIVRTNAFDQPKSALNRDLNALLRLWKKIKKESTTGKGTRLLYSDQDLVVQALRDYLDTSITEVLVDDDDVFAKAKGYMASFMPRAKTKLVRYTDRMPLFSRFNLEEQIDSIYRRSVDLPSGGSIVIDGTEALTAIDVNSGRGTRGGSQEENALRTNLQAAEEIARQLRMRDIGGLIVVDFIDMRASKNNRQVEKTLRDAMKTDKARHTVGKISPNGLLEINRQRIKKALELRSHRPCPTCSGSGTIASPESIGLSLLRRIEARAATGRIQGVTIELHPELADALQNDRRQELAALEREFDLRIEIIAAAGVHRSEEHIEWIKREDRRSNDAQAPQAAVSAADLAGGVSKKDEGEIVDDRKDESASSGDENGEPTTKSPRKRRRGGRRRKKSGAKAAETTDGGAAESGPEEHTPEAPEKPAVVEKQQENGDGGEAKKPKKRRRSRRSKKKSTGDADGSGASKPDGAKDDGKPATEPKTSLIDAVPPIAGPDHDPFAY